MNTTAEGFLFYFYMNTIKTCNQTRSSWVFNSLSSSLNRITRSYLIIDYKQLETFTLYPLILCNSSMFNWCISTRLCIKTNTTMQVDAPLVSWIKDYLPGRPQYVRLKCCVSDKSDQQHQGISRYCSLPVPFHSQVLRRHLSPSKVFWWLCSRVETRVNINLW